METAGKKKKIILLIVLSVIGLGVLLFSVWQPSMGNRLLGDPVSSSNPDISLLDASSFSSEVGQTLVRTLAELRSITMDTAFIEGAAFTNLGDFSEEIEPQQPGRSNPFAPAQ